MNLNSSLNLNKKLFPVRTSFFYIPPLVKHQQDVQFIQQQQTVTMELFQQTVTMELFQPQTPHVENVVLNQRLEVASVASNSSYCSATSVIKQQKIKKNYLQDFIYQKTIGKGSFGKVQKLKYNYSQKYVAAKVISKTPLEVSSNKIKITKLQNQIQIYKRLSHPNIARLLSVYQWKRQCTMIMELAQGQNLNKLMKEHPNSEITIAKIMFQVFYVLQYLGNINVAHRDIKAENIVYDQKTQIVKIIDFGEAVNVKNQNKQYGLGGTYVYFAPQNFQFKVTPKSDIWACGVLLYFLLSTELFFLDSFRDKQRIKKNILQKQITFEDQSWSFRSKQSKQLILKMLQRDPQKRISAKQAKQSQWIQSNVKNWRPTFNLQYQKELKVRTNLTCPTNKSNQSVQRSSSMGNFKCKKQPQKIPNAFKLQKLKKTQKKYQQKQNQPKNN